MFSFKTVALMFQVAMTFWVGTDLYQFIFESLNVITVTGDLINYLHFIFECVYLLSILFSGHKDVLL